MAEPGKIIKSGRGIARVTRGIKEKGEPFIAAVMAKVMLRHVRDTVNNEAVEHDGVTVGFEIKVCEGKEYDRVVHLFLPEEMRQLH